VTLDPIALVAIAFRCHGRYYITLSGRDGARQVGPTTFGLAVPYSLEYLDLGVDRKLLRDIAASSGGRLLPLSTAALGAVTTSSPQAPGPLWRVWWLFFLAALLLLVAEVAVRKVALPDAWRARWARWREAPRDVESPEPGDEGPRASTARERIRHLAPLRDGARTTADDTAARTRLYLAAGRARRR
jgi:hypothetical protein